MANPLTLPDHPLRAAAGVSTAETLGRYNVPRQVTRALRGAAESTGVGFEVLAAKAAIESGFQSNAQAPTSSARGLFQFIDQTWLDTVQKHGATHGLGNEAAAITRSPTGRLTVVEPAERARILALRDNPEISARLGAEHLKDVSAALTPALGRNPDVAELYLGHFLGVSGASKVLRAITQDPTRAASDLLPEAARANATLFKAADGTSLSATQFLGNIREKVGRTYATLGLEIPKGPINFAPAATGTAPGEAIASSEPFWWGSGAPARVAHAPERMMNSALVEVFNRIGRSQAVQDSGSDPAEGAGLPAALLEALRGGSQLPTSAGAAQRAYGGTAA